MPNRSSHIRAMRRPRSSTTPSSSTTAIDPTKPNSSPATVKMKSVCCSGTNRPMVCPPRNSPLPNSSPEPIAISAWVLL